MKKRDRAESQLNLFTDADFGMSTETMSGAKTTTEKSSSRHHSVSTTNKTQTSIEQKEALIAQAEAPVGQAETLVGQMETSVSQTKTLVAQAGAPVPPKSTSVGQPSTTNNKVRTRIDVPKETLGFESVQTLHYDLTDLFQRLSKSDFRSSFHLKYKDKQYIAQKGLETIRQHAADFVSKRLAPAIIPNDGKQTPMRGHPVFIAQHATACCCRGCFSKWHHIPSGRALTPQEQDYAVNVLMTWIEKEYKAT